MLTEREAQILGYLINGMRTKEAAKAAGLHPDTVKDYTERIRIKMQARTTIEAAAKAVRAGLA